MPQGAANKRIEKNEPVQVDYLSNLGGYMVDQAQTFFFGTPPEKFLPVDEIALAIQRAIAINAVIPSEGLAGTENIIVVVERGLRQLIRFVEEIRILSRMGGLTPKTDPDSTTDQLRIRTACLRADRY